MWSQLSVASILIARFSRKTSTGPVQVRHGSHWLATLSSHSLDRAGEQAKWLPLNFGYHDEMRTSPQLCTHTPLRALLLSVTGWSFVYAALQGMVCWEERTTTVQSGACKRDGRSIGVAVEKMLDDQKSSFRSIWCLWSLFSRLTFGVHNSQFSDGPISRTNCVHLNSQFEGAENDGQKRTTEGLPLEYNSCKKWWSLSNDHNITTHTHLQCTTMGPVL